MNEHFVCIKVDREERPDVDQVYMEAVHSMGLQGGWPLNVFLLPDQRPFYGGTYFPPKGWAQLCIQIHRAFSQQYDELAKSADGFMNTLARSEVEKYGLIGQGQAFTKPLSTSCTKSLLKISTGKREETTGLLNFLCP